MTEKKEMTREKDGIHTITTDPKDRCMYCKEMFDSYCAKSKKFVTDEEFYRSPYKPTWCKGRKPSDDYHD